jgi:ERO1-like protein beta
MRPAAKHFYLAVFALLGTSHAVSPGEASGKTRDPGPNVCAVSSSSTSSPPPSSTTLVHGRTTYTLRYQYEPNSIVSDACASYATLENINEALTPHLRSITQNTDFFSHYRLNLYNKKCPFWSDDNGMCGNIACSVNTLDNEEDIPLVWRAEELGKLEGPKAEHPGKQLQRERPAKKPLQGKLGEDVKESCIVEYDDECDERDYCVPEDERASSKGDYVSLVDNPERFTGYSGAGSSQVWDAIYRENCFSKPTQIQKTSLPGISPFSFNQQQQQAAKDLLSVMKEYNIQEGVKQAIAHGSQGAIDDLEFDQECIEKRVFYRVVSGMHASISTHICYEFLNQSTGQWSPNLECYKSRLHTHPERISNLYFNYALLLRAVGKLKNHLKDYTFCSADPTQDQETKALIMRLSSTIRQKGNIFDETVMFQSPDAAGLKGDFKNRFRNISRVMDCVGCDKCRLWGKLQTNGYGTALKVLFEFDEKNPRKDPPLRRTELVALVNTLNRVSNSLEAIKFFRETVEREEMNNIPKIQQPSARENISSATNTPLVDKKPEIERDDYPKPKDPKEQETLSQIFWEEFDLVWRTFKFVLRGWVEFPQKL